MKRQTVMVAFALGLVMASCSKDPLKDMFDAESRIYITQRDSTVNFRAFSTFSIADSVAYIGNSQTSSRFTTVDAEFIEAIKNQMQERGFLFASRNQNCFQHCTR